MIFITSPERSKRQGPFLDIPHQGTQTSNINWAGKETDQNPHLIYILLRLLVITTVIPKSRVSAEKQPVVLLSKSNCASAFPDTRCMHFDFFPASRFELLPSSSSIMRTARTARNGKATTSRQHEQTVLVPKLTNMTHQVKTVTTFWCAPTSQNRPDGVLALESGAKAGKALPWHCWEWAEDCHLFCCDKSCANHYANAVIAIDLAMEMEVIVCSLRCLYSRKLDSYRHCFCFL